ncbi:g1758 [Coccomyxa elongata]
MPSKPYSRGFALYFDFDEWKEIFWEILLCMPSWRTEGLELNCPHACYNIVSIMQGTLRRPLAFRAGNLPQ